MVLGEPVPKLARESRKPDRVGDRAFGVAWTVMSMRWCQNPHQIIFPVGM